MYPFSKQPTARQKRSERDRFEKDRKTNRKRVRSPYSTLSYYDDLGTTATKEGYAGWKENESAYQSALKEADSGMSEYQANIAKRKAELGKASASIHGDPDTWFNKEWEKFRDTDKGMVSLRVLGKDGKVEGSYRMHKDYLTPLYGSVFGVKNADKYQVENGAVTIDPYLEARSNPISDLGPSISDNKMKKLNSLGTEYSKATYDSFEKAVRPKLIETFGDASVSIGEGRSELYAAEKDYELQQKNLENSKYQRETADADRRASYVERIKNMNELFGRLDIEAK